MNINHKHTNQLISETSPYLLQHAHNPVNWYPWGEEALQKAKTENKPILVSIGYAACHWCHVMERESFENEATAALMNEYFVNIKIDREERPDLDHIYMDAVQAISGSGGWPLNVFLTPEAKPFFGGTYFPPVAAYNRASWQDVIGNIYQAFHTKRHEIDAQAENLTNHLLNANTFGNTQSSTDSIFTQNNLNTIAQNILKQSDTIWGGFGKAPKFPQTFSIQFLLRHYHFTKDENALQQALLSLDKMICGGIYDQLGGGFARYSTDNEWLAPHFEKMLYDNALLVNVLSEAYQITNNRLYEKAIRQTIQFVERELMHENGGFYSALDADSEGVEGKYYTWSKAELDLLLGDNATLFANYYGITEQGNWEHTNILWVQKTMETFALENGISVSALEEVLKKCNIILLEKRSQRIRPLLDDKILLSWNALMNTAICKAYAALGEPLFLQLVEKNIHFIEEKLQKQDLIFFHTYKNKVAKIGAFLDDYAYLIQTYIHLQEITGQAEYLIKAKKLTEYVIHNFSEHDTSFFFYTHQNQTDVIVRRKEVYDGAVPSGNAIMAANLHYLSIVFDRMDWALRAQQMIQSLNKGIVRYPTSFGVWAAIVQQIIVGTKELVVVGKEAFMHLPVISNKYIPNKVLQSTIHGNEDFPLLKGKLEVGVTSFFLCKNYACQKPEYSILNYLTII